MKYVLSIIFVFSTILLSAQTLPVLKPVRFGRTIEYSKQEQKRWQRALEQLKQINAGKLSHKLYRDSLLVAEKQAIDALEMGKGPLTMVGCGWYCGGGPYKTTATSELRGHSDIDYAAENVHDANLLTAWVPQKAQGASITFHFKPFSPRVNEIIIWNGYVKNTRLWEANSRVAKFKLSINGNEIAILVLEDRSNAQAFSIDPIQSQDSTKDLTISLEIAEVYKGSKYEDVVISEVNFSGLDVHCFGAGTKVTMSDGREKAIELLNKGDSVLSYDFHTGKVLPVVVGQLVIARHFQLLDMSFDKCRITVTDDHPFWVEGKGWASMDSVKSNEKYINSTIIQQLEIGDNVFLPIENRYIKLNSVKSVRKEQLTYTLDLIGGSSFIVNGLLVSTEIPKLEE